VVGLQGRFVNTSAQKAQQIRKCISNESKTFWKHKAHENAYRVFYSTQHEA
jgi:hypothetical protein